MKRLSLLFTAPNRVEVREDDLPAPVAGQVQVQAICSNISAGTEMLIYRGDAPKDLAADSTIAALGGSLAYPLKYGYSMVGRVVALGSGVDASWQGRLVFAFHPHESAFNERVEDLLALLDPVEPQEAAFLANMETAVNLILDGTPRMGENVVVLGQGIVGLFTTALLSRHPLDTLFTFDQYPLRRDFSLKLGAHQSFDPDLPGARDQALSRMGSRRADLVYELSGNPEALNHALALAGDEGRVVIGSWYGERKAAIDLGGHFHRGRIKISSSQVSHLAPALSGRWDRPRRFEQARKFVAEIRPSHLITHQFKLAEADKAYSMLAMHPEQALAVQFTY